LGVFVAAVPPLRCRRSDIPVLAEHFLRRANAQLRLTARGFTEPATSALMRAPWLGNAFELRNVVEHAALVAGERLVGVECLPSLDPTASPSPSSPKVVVPVGTSAADAERKLILATLEHTGFNKAEAARTLDLDVKTVRAKLRAYGIPPAGFADHVRVSSG
jgi:two-component system response regulator AtoC